MGFTAAIPRSPALTSKEDQKFHGKVLSVPPQGVFVLFPFCFSCFENKPEQIYLSYPSFPPPGIGGRDS